MNNLFDLRTMACLAFSSVILRAALAFLLMVLLIGCANSDPKSPIPESHPAYKFYKIAKAGPTSLDVCESYGGVEIYPIDYEMIEALAQGVAKIRHKPTGKVYLGVSFSEGGMITTVDLCCWPWEQPSSDAESYNDRGVIYIRKDLYDKAISDFNKAIELNPQYAEAYKNRGFAYGLKGQHDKAISDYSRAIELEPSFAIPYVNRGAAYANKGQHDKVVRDLTKAIELDPSLAIAYYHRAIAYFFLKDYDRSWDDIKKTQALGYRIDPAFLTELRKASGLEE